MDWKMVIKNRVQEYNSKKHRISTTLNNMIEELRNEIGVAAIVIEEEHLGKMYWRVRINGKEECISYDEIKLNMFVPVLNPKEENEKVSLKEVLEKILLEKFKWN